MTHAQIRAFHYVAKLGGFSAAAAALGLTQPAISDQIRKLEHDNDVLLFSRQRRKVELTAAGEELYAKTRAYFDIEGEIRSLLSERASRIEGELRIMVDSAGHIGQAVQRFRARHPHVRIVIGAGNSQEVIAGLRAFSADIGVIGTREAYPDMVMQDLSESEIVAFARDGLFPPSKTSVSVAELRALPLVLRERGSKTRQQLDEFGRETGQVFEPAVVAEGREAVREIVASSDGIGIVSRAELGEDRRIRPLTIEGVRLVMRETAVHLRQRKDVRAIREFMRLCQASADDAQPGAAP